MCSWEMWQNSAASRCGYSITSSNFPYCQIWEYVFPPYTKKNWEKIDVACKKELMMQYLVYCRKRLLMAH